MSRFLIVVPPLAGHINPLLGVAAELLRGRQDVHWAGPPDLLARLAGDLVAVHPIGSGLPTAEVEHRPPDLRGFAALRFLWEEFLIPLADSTVPELRDVVAEVRPDVVVADQQTLSGPICAIEAGLAWVTSASTSAEFSDPLAATPRVADWRRDLLAGLAARHLPDAGTGAPNLYLSPHLVLAFTTEALVRAGQAPPHTVFAGPSLSGRSHPTGFCWNKLRLDRPIVLVTLGTVNSAAGTRFFQTCLDAHPLLPVPVQLVVVDPGATLPPSTTDDVLVVPRIPQLDLLPFVSAVVCHAGHNTVCESLLHGVPLVLAPIRDDQPVIAQQVVDAGAGLRIRFGHAGAPQLATALADVLTHPTYRERARAIGQSFLAAGGAARAAQALQHLARNRPARDRLRKPL